MKIPAEKIHRNDLAFLAGEWLRVTSYALVKENPNQWHYSLVKIWFSDGTAFTASREYEIEVKR